MRHFLICSGLRSRGKSLEWLQQAVEIKRPDGILFAGGALNGMREYTARGATPWGLTRDDAHYLEQLFATLGHLGLFTAIIPGPSDTPVLDFLRMGMHAELEFPNLHLVHATPNLHLVHATLIEKGDMAVCGMGGCLCEETHHEGDQVSRIEAEYHLRGLAGSRKPHKVMLLGSPPTGQLGGNLGCRLVADLIDSCHPSLCIVSGPSEGRGTQRIARTLVVNPGEVAEGWMAYLDRRRSGDDAVEWLDLHDLSRSKVTAEVGVGD
jgi:hypothetical protein